MQYLSYNERKQRGTFDFPIEIYCLNELHPQYVMAFHWHMEYELIRIRRGLFHMTLDEEQFTAREGDLIFVNSGTLHAGTPENCEYDCIVFNMGMLVMRGNACQALLQKVIDREIWVDQMLPSNDPELAGVVCALFSAMESKRRGYQLVVQGCLFQFFGLVMERGWFSSTPPENHRNYKRVGQLKRALAMIEENYAAPLTLEQLSSAVGMSPKYFCRFFREMTCRTPIEYLNLCRVEHACYQLISSDRSVTEIAFNCGFNDLSYFIKTFKWYKGITPKRYLTASAEERAGA